MRIVFYVLTTTILATLQTTWLSVALLLVFVVAIGMLRGKREGAILGAAVGILCDIMSPRIIGINAILYMYIGYFTGVLCGDFFRHKRIVVLLFVIAAELAYSLLYYFFSFFIWGEMHIGFALSKIILPELAYTAVIAIPLYVLLEKIDERIN
ncbi:hypothetical protein FACS189425_08040 [Clostridia bacterium]|nr:hypothetical protein FACS189425_08040 [Clostridia bacterium]